MLTVSYLTKIYFIEQLAHHFSIDFRFRRVRIVLKEASSCYKATLNKSFGNLTCEDSTLTSVIFLFKQNKKQLRRNELFLFITKVAYISLI